MQCKFKLISSKGPPWSDNATLCLATRHPKPPWGVVVEPKPNHPIGNLVCNGAHVSQRQYQRTSQRWSKSSLSHWYQKQNRSLMGERGCVSSGASRSRASTALFALLDGVWRRLTSVWENNGFRRLFNWLGQASWFYYEWSIFGDKKYPSCKDNKCSDIPHTTWFVRWGDVPWTT